MIERLSPLDVEAVFDTVCGEPNRRLSQPGKPRYGRKGSLACDVERRCFTDFANGASGGLLDLIVHKGHAADRADAVKWLREFLGSDRPCSDSRPQAKAELSDAAKIKRAREIFGAARPAAGTPAEAYLRSRAIAGPIPASLRYHPQLFNAETKQHLRGLVAAVTPLDAPDVINAVLRTYITRDGRKADVPMPKKTLGCVLNGGIILAEFADSLVIGEGVETTMSASAHLQIPGVATLGTSGMKRIAIPARVERVVIAFDRDANGAGRAAAEYLARRLWAQGVEVQFARPPGNFNDWNDAARAGAL
jgi:hypothetical protein